MRWLSRKRPSRIHSKRLVPRARSHLEKRCGFKDSRGVHEDIDPPMTLADGPYKPLNGRVAREIDAVDGQLITVDALGRRGTACLVNVS